MIHTMLKSIHDNGPFENKVDAQTVTTKQKKFVSLSSTLSKDQLRKQLHTDSLRLPTNIGITLAFVGLALVLASISYWFFSGIRQDYGQVVVARDNCHMKEFWSDYGNNRPPEPWQMEVCDYTYEDKNYTDPFTVMKWIVRGGFGCGFAWLTVLAAQAMYRRLVATRANVRAFRSPEPSDIVRTFALDGYQWDMLQAGLSEEYRKYDGSCFKNEDEPWELMIDALTESNKLGVKLDKPVSDYLIATDKLATDEKRGKPLKEQRDEAVAYLAGLTATKLFPLLVQAVNVRRDKEARRLNRAQTPDQDFLDEANRNDEERNAAINIAAALETVI